MGWRLDTYLWYGKGIQKQLNGHKKFCEKIWMIVNDTKTKVMPFGKTHDCNVYFNDKQIE